MVRINPLTASVVEPPVAEAKSWVAGRTFPADRPLVNLAQAVPSYPPARELREHLAEVVRRDDTAGYGPTFGLPELRAAIAELTSARYGGRVAVEQTMVTAGCNQAYCLAIGALAGPGDEVVLPVPYYFNHDMWLRANAIRPVYVTLDPAAGLVPDPAAIDACIGPRTRAVVLVTPNNPAGVSYPPEVIDTCADLARRRGVVLVLDETYRDFRAEPDPPHHAFAADDWPEHVVQLFSFSKLFSLAGYRAGSLVAGEAVLQAAAKLLDCETICTPRVAQEAVAFGLAHLDSWAAERRAEMLGRVDGFRTALAAAGTGYELVASGAYFAYVRHPFAGEPALKVARRLADDHHLLCIPGEAFGPAQEPFLRLAFGNVEAHVLPEVAARLAASES